MPYVEIFAGPVAADQMETYRHYAEKMSALTLKAGALSATAGWSAETPQGMLKPLAGALAVGPGEALVTRIVRWPSAEARAQGWAAMMADPEMQAVASLFTIDRTRVHFAAFEEIAGA